MSGVLSKCLPFNLERKLVCIPPRKREKYLARINSWVPGSSISLRDCQSVIGCLQHCTQVISEGRSYLPSLFRLAASFKGPSKPFIKHQIPSAASEDVAWWRSRLSADLCGCSIPSPSAPLPISIFVDAASSFGIGFLADDRWLAWRLLDGWNSDGRDIGWAEMVAVDLGLRTLIHSGLKNRHLVFHSDNTGVVGALTAGRSRVSAQNEVLQYIVSNFRVYNIWPCVKWIRSADNKSDCISRGVFPSSLSRHPRPPPLPKYLKRFVSLV